MSNQELPVVITAISDAQFEGFVSGTLFAQGWSVVFRAIDTEAIERYCSNNVEQASSSLLIYSPDLPGITLDVVKQLSTKVKQVVGFSTQTNTEFVDLHPIPATATDGPDAAPGQCDQSSKSQSSCVSNWLCRQ